ncbi:LysM peptidoglycan-binding domain-containing protein [Paenibacillus thermotolerans]|uniref:LysM peptidoglycan-binding domain-containing protein n=1 Tax=Paenibacillus thermotolerans TaxID=3027807 RepID=UPI0023686241|nr:MULTISPECIES: LysM peptidoglycan-binding domain-containing protein [unclassified Paenibacillus]
MAQQTSGLRFDIYERVYLPEDGAGMRELTSIELTPEITVEYEGDQAVLKGHLFLSGSYTSAEDPGVEGQLTHRIPVEITLPSYRIRSVEDINVEIENFDIDLLSARCLNVTGVLSLHGIEVATYSAADWNEKEEVVFTHRAEEEAPAPSTPWAAAAQAAEAAEAIVFEAGPNAEQTDRTEKTKAQAAKEAVEPANEPEFVPANEVFEPSLFENEPLEEAAEEYEPAPAAEEKKEIKIAFAGKTEEPLNSEPLGPLNAFISSPAPEAVRSDAPADTAAEAPQAEQRSESENRDRLEWKKLFLNKTGDAPQFRRVKMVIAQKEDTIEAIAERYKKNARELMLHNRLNDQYLQEGQVVYIP